jgi:coenzyme F420-0:L-glutamate ligase/coenzyme F420-1:gamma-L-glutamate ligase
MAELRIFALEGMGEIEPGMDVAEKIELAIGSSGEHLVNGDVVVVTHKIVSKAEGRIVDLPDAGPDSHRYLVDQEAASIVRRREGLVIAETRHGFICANAGVDRSNAGSARAILLPIDPDKSANRIRMRLNRRYDAEVAVIITDTFGRAWRRGLVDVAIGVAGMDAINDLRGEVDDFGNVLAVTEIATVDELAAAADLVIGKASRRPVAIVRGLAWKSGSGGVAPLIRPADEDLFR